PADPTSRTATPQRYALRLSTCAASESPWRCGLPDALRLPGLHPVRSPGKRSAPGTPRNNEALTAAACSPAAGPQAATGSRAVPTARTATPQRYARRLSTCAASESPWRCGLPDALRLPGLHPVRSPGKRSAPGTPRNNEALTAAACSPAAGPQAANGAPAD